MTAAPHSIDPTTYLDDLLAQASPDLMRQMLQGFINQILSAQTDTVCGAEYGVVSTERVVDSPRGTILSQPNVIRREKNVHHQTDSVSRGIESTGRFTLRIEGLIHDVLE